jgi:hypothetical protein
MIVGAEAGVQAGVSLENGENLVGRLIGLPGDAVEVINGTPRINGQAWDEPYLPPDFQSHISLPLIKLQSSEYFILPEDRHLIEELKDELVVVRNRIRGREILSRWPLGWWLFRPTAFLSPQPIAQPKIP